MPIEVPNLPPMRTVPVTTEATTEFPDQPLQDDVNGIAELSAHAAITSRKPGTANDNEEERDARHS